MGKNIKFKFLELSEKEYNSVVIANNNRKKIRMFGSITNYDDTLYTLHKYLDNTTAMFPIYIGSHLNDDPFLTLHCYAFEVEERHLIRGVLPMEFVYHEGICFEVTFKQGILLSVRKPLLAM